MLNKLKKIGMVLFSLLVTFYIISSFITPFTPNDRTSLTSYLSFAGTIADEYLFENLPNDAVRHYYVSGGGSNNFSGLKATSPVKTIQNAIDKASSSSYTKQHAVIHLLPEFSAANTLYKFGNYVGGDTIATASVTSGYERLLNATIYIYRSNIHFVAEGPLGSVVIKPDVPAEAGVVSIKAGMSNISFHGIVFDMTTAANEAIQSRASTYNLHIKNCRFILGVDVVDLDGGLALDCIIENCEFYGLSSSADGSYISIAPVRGRIVNNLIIHSSVTSSTSAMIEFAVTGNTGYCLVENNKIHGGDASGGVNQCEHGIELIGTGGHEDHVLIVGNYVAATKDTLIVAGGDDDVLIANFTNAGATGASNVALDLTHIKY
ncbi:MAG: hypothetical protein H8D45_24295 [Bacteroidetes bacterium]|nr:hypothetical protein [Bacteroidota bacterium]